MVLGECKWMLEAADRKVMADLAEDKASKIIPEQGRWRVHFLGFSRSGWTSGAREYEETIQRQPISGSNLADIPPPSFDLGARFPWGRS